MRNLFVCFLAAFLAASTLRAESPVIDRPAWPETPRMGKWWKLSSAILAAAVAADAHSSWGRMEANPLLRGPDGRFGTRGLALKAALIAGTVGAQYLLLRKHPSGAKYGVAANLAIAGVLGGAAISNHVRAARPAYLTSQPGR